MIFFCEDACAVLLMKEKKYSPINVKIVCPEGWISGSNSWRKEKLDFLEPNDYISHYIQ